MINKTLQEKVETSAKIVQLIFDEILNEISGDDNE